MKEIIEQKVYGSERPCRKRIVNPADGIWAAAYCARLTDDGWEWYEQWLPYEPTDNEIRRMAVSHINAETDEKILTGFEWRDMPVWLSQENQFNYKAAYDLAVQTGGASLPVTFKFGTDEEPQYHVFETLEELTDFYRSALAHISETLAAGWAEKDSIDRTGFETT